ncbi:MAG: DegT/DnrJ/EryC1/StrS family aminotransferase [Candidatus Daviesbacteria bacterium]|nr:DegT/DnrJ/EryC1/StrS family aminotransferase [Candidatus Daviesbacteria bacterium]
MINVTKTTLPPINKYIKYLKKVWMNNWITNKGEFTLQLEKELKNYLKVKNLSVVSNGTIAMQLAFKALKLKGEVITTPFTFPATTNSLIWEGLKPVFADIDPETFNIDAKEIEKKITKETSAILAVHVFGNPCDVEAIEKIAKKYNLKIIYDSAHAFGIEYKDKSVLSWGDINTLSFHAAKVFHTAEGGAVIARKKRDYQMLDLLKNHGIEYYDKVVIAGINAKMNELQAIMGLCVLEDFEKSIIKRKKIYQRYKEAFLKNPLIKIQKLHNNLTKYTYPYFPVFFPDEKTRERIFKVLLKNGIRARKYFYPPCHEFPYIKYSSSDLPNATKISHTILCLPLYATLTTKDHERIINLVNKALLSL